MTTAGRCIALASLFLLPLSVQADDPSASDEDLQSRVERLVLELDAPQLAQRNTAERSLKELGTQALPFLPPEDAKQPPELGRRLARIRAQIAEHDADASIENRSGDVRLGNAASVGAALEAISRDSGVEFEHDSDPDQPLAPYDAPLPFWHAIDHVLDHAQLDIDFYSSDSQTLVLRPRRPGRPARVDSAAYAGLFRLEPEIVTSRRVLRDASLSGLNVELEISWKPDAHPVGITLPLAQIKAKLDDGATVGAQQSQGTIDVAPPNELATMTIQLPLELPAGRPGKIETLSGRIQSMLPGAIRRFEFPLNLQPQTQTADFVTVRLESIRKNGPLHEIRLGVEYQSPGRAMESHRGWLLGNELFVTTADGKRHDHLGYELFRHNESGIGIGYLFDVGDSPAGATLTYLTPTAVVQHEIDFVIRDIPMP